MQIKCGTDIIEIDRVEASIKKTGSKFLKRVYTENEIEYCESKKSMKYQHYAARFAAKEAVFKAISEELGSKYEIDWKNIEVVNDNTGRPKINFINMELKQIKQCDISISHCKKYATANVVVVIEGEK